ncbi:hypothetical protein ES702_03614 [subsurface metagenome]
MRLSAVEQRPRPRTIYTQLCFCYDVPHGRMHEQILERLHQGLKHLTSFVPWVAGQVVEDEGVFSVAPLDNVPRLTSRDFTTENSMPTMQQLKDAKFPFNMLDEKLICPRNTLSDGPNQDDTHPYPVLLLQANFVRGGMLLTILTCHSVMDIVGQVQIIKLLSKACNGEAPTDVEIADCNMDRQHLIPVLDDKEREAGKDLVIARPVLPVTSPSSPQSVPTAPKLRWAYFQFSDDALRTLKSLATSTLPESVPFVSTDDCICALLWQSLARVCLARLDSAAHLHFSRQADVRKYMNVPATYPGNMVASVNTALTLTELTTESLGTLAFKMRALLVPEVLVYTLRDGAIVPEDRRTQEKQEAWNQEQKQYRDNKRIYRENTIIMSSWTKADCNDVNFNLGLGKPVAVRRPMFTPYEGVVYLLPKGRDGEILAGWCLCEEDIDGLRKDEEFCKWAEYIG